MFIKLTRLDGTPIWFESKYLITVEPRRGSGALVVPLGDGLDYEVRESPERIVEMCEGKSGKVEEWKSGKVEEPEVKPVMPPKIEVAEAKPPTPPQPKIEVVETKPWSKGRRVKSVLTPEQTARLKRMTPGNVRKLENTLRSQFNVADPAKEVRAQEWAGNIHVREQGRIEWVKTETKTETEGAK